MPIHSLTRLLFKSFFVVTISANADVVTVRNLNDDGADSLRQVIRDASAGDTVIFVPSLNGQTIKLDGAQLVVSKTLTIDASTLSEGLIIDADRRSAVLRNFAKPIRLGGDDITATLSSIQGPASAELALNRDFTDFAETLPTDANPALTSGPGMGFTVADGGGEGFITIVDSPQTPSEEPKAFYRLQASRQP